MIQKKGPRTKPDAALYPKGGYTEEPGVKTAISVAMATYNGAPFVEQQLASLGAQRLLPSELVICDDGSIDGTVQRIKAAAARLPFPVSVEVNKANLGYRANFMKVASLCRGDVIFFCDQDDIWRPEKLSAIMPAFDDPTVLMAHHNSRLFDTDGRTIREMHVDWRRGRTYGPMTISPWEFPLGFSQAFRRSLLTGADLREKVPDFHDMAMPVAHDHWTAFLAQSLGRTTYVDQVLVDYRQHTSNSFKRDWTPKDSGPWGAIRDKLSNFPDFRVLEACCGIYAAILRQLAERGDLDPKLRFPAGEAANSYEAMALLYRHRATAYAASSLGVRARAWRTLIKENGYAPPRASRGWAFAPSQRLKDLVSGVLFGALRHRLPDIKHDFGLKHYSLYQSSIKT